MVMEIMLVLVMHRLRGARSSTMWRARWMNVAAGLVLLETPHIQQTVQVLVRAFALVVVR